MKYIVVGGAGFIGSNLTDLLIDEGHEVVVIDNVSTGSFDNIHPKALFVNTDIKKIGLGGPALFKKQRASVLKNFEKCDGIFHLAALARVQPSLEDPIEYNQVNVNGTLNILNLAKRYNIKRVVYSASSSAYGNTDTYPTNEDCPVNPLSPYGLQKMIGEQYCKLFSTCYGVDTVSLRYFNVFGPKQSIDGAYSLVMGIFAKQKISGEPLTITGDGEQRRDFTFVKDVARANLLAMEHKENLNGEVFNIGNGDNRSINQIAEIFGGDKEYTPERLEPKQTLADNSKAKKILNWKPTVSVEDWLPGWVKDLKQ